MTAPSPERDGPNPPASSANGTPTIRAIPRGEAAAPASPLPVVDASGLVDASHAAGGFTATAEGTTCIALRWAVVPRAVGYMIFRGTQPKFALTMDSVLTLDATYSADRQDRSSKHWLDNQVEPGERYYYAVVARIGEGSYVAATGNYATPAKDSPLEGVDDPPR